MNPEYLHAAFSPDAEGIQFPRLHARVSGRRYYSPSQGRFLGRDPIEENGGLNLYGFVLNNPINAWDYLGMNTFLVWEPYYDDAGNMLGTRMVEHDGFTTQISGRANGDDRIETDFGYLSRQYFETWGIAEGWRTGNIVQPFNALTEAANALAIVTDLELLGSADSSSGTIATGNGKNIIYDVQIGNAVVIADETGAPTPVQPVERLSQPEIDSQAALRGLNNRDGNGDWAAVVKAGQHTFGNPVFQQPLTTLATGAVQATALVGAVYAGVSAAPVVVADVRNNLHIEARGKGTVVQVRYRSTPLIRLDYNRYPGSGAEPRLHLNIGPGKRNIHIPIDPRSWFE